VAVTARYVAAAAATEKIIPAGKIKKAKLQYNIQYAVHFFHFRIAKYKSP